MKKMISRFLGLFTTKRATVNKITYSNTQSKAHSTCTAQNFINADRTK